MFRFAVNVLLISSLAIVAVTFVASRAALFRHGYNQAVEALERHKYVDAQCSTHSDWLRFKPDMCAEARAEKQRQPSSVAFEYMLANTHSCGQWPCSSLYSMILEKTNHTLFNVALAAGSLVIFYALVLRIMGSAWQNASAKQYAHLTRGEPGYIENGQEPLIEYYLPPGAYLQHRRRPGAQLYIEPDTY